MDLADVKGPSELLRESSELTLCPLEHSGTQQVKRKLASTHSRDTQPSGHIFRAFAEKSKQRGGGRSDGLLTSNGIQLVTALIQQMCTKIALHNRST